MAATKNFVNSFKGQLEYALKTAAVNAAVNLIRSNPELTLEDFYTVMRPQGVTETITVGELAAAFTGKPVAQQQVASTPARATRTALPAATPEPAPAKTARPKKRRRPARPPKVNCLTEEGRAKYRQSILERMAETKDWMRNNEIRPYCGGETHQFTPFMRNYLIDEGLVRTRGTGPGKQYRITGKGLKKIGKFPKVADKKPKKSGDRRTNGSRSALTLEGQHEIHQDILRFLDKQNDVVTGTDIRNAVNITKHQLKSAMGHLIPDKMVKATGATFGRRYNITAKGRMNVGRSRTDRTIQVTAKTNAGRAFLRKGVLRFLHGNRWRSIAEIAEASGGTKNQMKTMLYNLLKEGVIEHNGRGTTASRYRLARK